MQCRGIKEHEADDDQAVRGNGKLTTEHKLRFAAYLAYEQFITGILKTPGGQMWWAEARNVYILALQERIDHALTTPKSLDQLAPTIWWSVGTPDDA